MNQYSYFADYRGVHWYVLDEQNRLGWVESPIVYKAWTPEWFENQIKKALTDG